MPLVNFRDRTFDADVEATRAAYARAKTGGCELCGCDTCRNFALSRREAYPDEALRLFEQLGIDAGKEGEAYWATRAPDGLHQYGRWFHFVGALVSGPAVRVPVGENVWQLRLAKITPTCSLGFDAEAAAPCLEPLRGLDVVQIEFDTAVPWRCDRPEPEFAM